MIKFTFRPEYLSYQIVRVRGGYPREQYLTKDGWVERDPQTMIEVDDTMLWDEDDVRDLATEIAKAGIKPREASYTEGELEATKKHLEDMRTLVLKVKR